MREDLHKNLLNHDYRFSASKVLKNFGFGDDAISFVETWVKELGEDSFIKYFDLWDYRKIGSKDLRKIYHDLKFGDKFNKMLDGDE